MMMTLNGMFSEPKPHRINIIKENIRKIKQISSAVSQNVKDSQVDMAKSQSSETEVGKQLRNSSSRINSTSSGRLNKKSTITVYMCDRKNDMSSTTALFPPSRTSSKSLYLLKHQSCQTIDPKNYDQLFCEGTIMYPSSKVLEQITETEKQKENRLDAHVKKEFLRKNRFKSKSPTKTLHKTNIGEKKNKQEEIVKSDEGENKIPRVHSPGKTKGSVTKIISKPKIKDLNPDLKAADIIRKTTEDHLQFNGLKKPEGGKPSNHGDFNLLHTPKTAKKCFNKRSKKEDSVLKTVLDPMCPPGHIPLPDQERKKTLHMLRVSYAELIREMNLLPVRTDTLRIRQRKIQLENQLNKIEEGIKVFNKSKVYVKIEE